MEMDVIVIEKLSLCMPVMAVILKILTLEKDELMGALLSIMILSVVLNEEMG